MSAKSTVFVRRLGRHHFAHLRSIAEGLDVQESAKRYLGIEHGHQAKTAHQQAVDAVRAIARRRGDPAWRLIGLRIKIKLGDDKPSLEDFMAERGLDGWSESEVTEMYQEAYPADRKATRGQRLHERQFALLLQLEGLAAEQPMATDMVSGWYDDLTATKLISAGFLTLGNLNTRVSTGGRWYAALPGIGSTKARRIASHLRTLLPAETQKNAPFPLDANFGLFARKQQNSAAEGNYLPHISRQTEDFRIGAPLSEPPSSAVLLDEISTPPFYLTSGAGALPCLLSAGSDQEAVDAWIAARAGSELTATTYRREALRLMLWLQYEAGHKTFATMGVNDCGDYMAFLQDIPAKWITRVRAKPGAPGWAPFRGQLSHGSRGQAVIIIAALFTWLQSAQYLTANPWVLINQKTGDDPGHSLLDTKALSEGAMSEILNYIEAQAPSPSRSRIRFILRFVESVGLRSQELLNARLRDLSLEPEGWVIQVHGKGAKNRIAAVPGQAFDAMQEYLALRGIGGIETAPGNAPLLASAVDPMEPVGYQALYEHVRNWLQKAVRASALPSHERMKLAGASTHWLRHTFGTRAIARDVPLDVIQAQMGHASIQTTTAIYGRAPIKRRVDELGKAFS